MTTETTPQLPDARRPQAEAHDRRYDFATCPGCSQRYQLIDWRCAVHQLYHPGGQIPAPPAPADVARFARRASGEPDVYARHGIEIPACPSCNGYGFEEGKPARGWGDSTRPGCPACGATGEGLDELTAELTAFPTFRVMLEALGGYYPSLYTCQGDGRHNASRVAADPGFYARIRALADAYDQAQANRGDERRAYRGG